MDFRLACHIKGDDKLVVVKMMVFGFVAEKISFYVCVKESTISNLYTHLGGH